MCDKLKLLFFLSLVFSCSYSLDVLDPSSEPIEIEIKNEKNPFKIRIGKEGYLYFITEFNDTESNIFNSSNIEENTYFETTITDESGQTYNVDCRLWKPLSANLKLFCKLNQILNKKTNIITLKESSFTYNNTQYKVFSQDSFTVEQSNISFPFLYGDEQIINFEPEKDSYELKFKIGEYHNELLMLFISMQSILILDNCSVNEQKNELICQIKKTEIE